MIYMLKGLRIGVLTLIAATATVSSAQIFTLTDTNTSVKINTLSSVGLFDWIVGGTDQVFSNTYAWRVGDSSIADAVQNLTQVSAVQTGTRFLDVGYVNNTLGFRIDITYVLTGGATSFDVAEIVRVTNIGNNVLLPFRLFQYNDFDLNNTANNDTATRINSSQMQQVDGVLSLNMVSEGATPVPAFSQVGPLFFTTLTTTSGYNLDTAAGLGLGQNFTGDAAYGFQWNQNLGVGQSFTISTDKIAAVPEPGTMVALGLGAIALLRRRKKA
ncbi:MAG: PEP-CTERM sorting domain-containing protein [Chlorobia bacterium]|nr:PEP-CTERM sorting domain-containing protein [Fimbriimonadaceae bacterium]